MLEHSFGELLLERIESALPLLEQPKRGGFRIAFVTRQSRAGKARFRGKRK